VHLKSHAAQQRRHSFVVTGRIYPKGSSAGIVFTHRPIFRFFPTGATRCTDQGEILQERSSLPNFTLIGSGMWVYGTQKFKNFEFYQYNFP